MFTIPLSSSHFPLIKPGERGRAKLEKHCKKGDYSDVFIKAFFTSPRADNNQKAFFSCRQIDELGLGAIKRFVLQESRCQGLVGHFSQFSLTGGPNLLSLSLPLAQISSASTSPWPWQSRHPVFSILLFRVAPIFPGLGHFGASALKIEPRAIALPPARRSLCSSNSAAWTTLKPPISADLGSIFKHF